ncbi:uncharacterized protein LOC110991637 isoform X2 [Pieris rapae]|uniref:uncharacterized protein LOC110991637 isoform X2 n=1 Tax=Pieris rapae TaxID=64459 RepID=UPI001E27F714|nr:uncharacterized protein LOC110991637 isoform X2 [Pieris rapae]
MIKNKDIDENIACHLNQILKTVIQQDENEEIANELTSEILSKLNISINKLPPKSLKILQDCVKYRDLTLDPMSISLLETKVISEKFQDEYEILKLNQMNARLQMKIDRNNKYIEGLKKELLSSRQSLMQQNPNPENIHESIRQVKQKLAVYEQSCEKAKTNFASLKVDEVILPKSLMSLVTSLAALREEAANLKRDADDVLFMKEAVSNMKMIRG